MEKDDIIYVVNFLKGLGFMKNVVITGSTRGLGLAMAKEFLKAGCNVTISGSRLDSFDRERNQVNEFEKQFVYVPCNVRNISEIRNLWLKSVEKWGSIDIWINNAGQNSPHLLCHEIDESYVNKIIDTNIKGMIFASQVAAREMLKQGFGQIYNMEGLGSNNMIQIKTILYGTTKHALTYFTRGLAKELKDTPIKVSRLSPGMMLTDFITKTPDGIESEVIHDKAFKFIFNVLGDRPEIVAKFFIKRILNNKKNDTHIVWLTKAKMLRRFFIRPLLKKKLI
jgi:NAD(P)-dependent dehydrogenase (short-subunit alcohol dehydrogenase family)